MNVQPLTGVEFIQLMLDELDMNELEDVDDSPDLSGQDSGSDSDSEMYDAEHTDHTYHYDRSAFTSDEEDDNNDTTFHGHDAQTDTE